VCVCVCVCVCGADMGIEILKIAAGIAGIIGAANWKRISTQLN